MTIIWKLIRGRLQWYVLWLVHSTFMVGVTGVVLDDHGRVLLLQHRFHPDGSWGLPGGYARAGERFEDTLVREVRDETGYVIGVGSLVRLVSGYKLRLEVIYLARWAGGSQALDTREVLAAAWFPTNELPDGVSQVQRNLIMLATASSQPA